MQQAVIAISSLCCQNALCTVSLSTMQEHPENAVPRAVAGVDMVTDTAEVMVVVVTVEDIAVDTTGTVQLPSCIALISCVCACARMSLVMKSDAGPISLQSCFSLRDGCAYLATLFKSIRRRVIYLLS